MGEEAWLKGTSAPALLRVLKGRAGARKLRLFTCACARRVEPFVSGVDARAIVEVAERGTPGAGDPRAWESARLAAAGYRARSTGNDWHLAQILAAAVAPDAWDATERALLHLTTFETALRGYTLPTEHTALVREVFGNPFRAPDFEPWRTETAVLLAQGMYEARDFSAMPILADALQDAGCDSEDVLGHCRDETASHVRGCWVLDGVLARA